MLAHASGKTVSRNGRDQFVAVARRRRVAQEPQHRAQRLRVDRFAAFHDGLDARADAVLVAELAQKAAAQRRVGVDRPAFDENLECGLPAEKRGKMPRAEHDAEAAARKREARGRSVAGVSRRIAGRASSRRNPRRTRLAVAGAVRAAISAIGADRS